MGDRTPSQFLRHLRRLGPDVSDSLIRSIWTSRLPSYLQTPLLCLTDSTLDTAAAFADRLIQSLPSPSLNLTSTPPNHSASVDRRSSSGERSSSSDSQCRSLHRSHEPRHRRSNSRERRSPSSDRLYRFRRDSTTSRYSTPSRNFRSPSSDFHSKRGSSSRPCWYHHRFGALAKNCSPPCSFHHPGKLDKQTSVAVPVCSTSTNRLFITDHYTSHRFLIDTCSDLCVLPHKHRARLNYDLCAANSSTIHTYGWLPLRLNLGLRRDFTWRFIVADVTHPIIGADFLSHFGHRLLIDCK
jgi:hypothetical protein